MRIIWVGRAAKLILKGPQSNLEIIIAYFPTGTEVGEADRYGALPDATGNSFPELWHQIRQRIASSLAGKRRALTVLACDFNHVSIDADKMNLNTVAAFGRRDMHEAGNFQAIISNPFGLHETGQQEFTYASKTARARLDCIYANHLIAEQLDRPSGPQQWNGSSTSPYTEPCKSLDELLGTLSGTSPRSQTRRVALEHNELCRVGGVQIQDQHAAVLQASHSQHGQ